MELLDLVSLAAQSDIPLQATTGYRDRFIMFVPSVRIGRKLMHPVEAVDVLRSIQEWERAGRSPEEIEEKLIERMPVTVISAQAIESDARGVSGSGRPMPRIGQGAAEMVPAERVDGFERRVIEWIADFSAECRMRDQTAKEEAWARHEETRQEFAGLQRLVERSSLVAERGADLVAQRLVALARGDAERADLLSKIEALARRVDGDGDASRAEWLRHELEEHRGRMAMLGLELGLMAGAVTRLATIVESGGPDPALGLLRGEIAERNAAFTRTIASLTAILRGEFARLTDGIDDLHARLADLSEAADDGHAAVGPVSDPAMDDPLTASRPAISESGSDGGAPGPTRPPRRMGQPTRPNERWTGDLAVGGR